MVPLSPLLLFGTGNVDQEFDHMVQQPHFFRIGSFIVHFFPGPAAGDQPLFPQDLQMVAQGRAAHLHQGGQVDHTLFHMAQEPEQFDPVGIGQAAEQGGNRRKIGILRQIL